MSEEGKEGDNPPSGPNIEVLVDQLFSLELPEEYLISNNLDLYPESILQQTEKGTKLYNSLQSFNKQFISNNDQTRIIQWTNSTIQVAERLIVDQWINSDHDISSQQNKQNIQQGDSKISNNIRRSKTISQNSNSKTLFSWSTGDSHLKYRKRELEQRGHKRSISSPGNSVAVDNGNGYTHNSNIRKDDMKSIKEEAIQDSSLASRLNLSTPKVSITNRLNKVIEQESNKFIHDRIQLIKTHHNEQISKKIHQRKRKDHELHLKRLREKEEEYETALRAAMTDQNQVRQGGFFGSIFGLSSMNATSKNHQQSFDSPSSRPSSESRHSSTYDATSSNNNNTILPNKSKRFSFLPATGMSLWGSAPKSPESNRKEKVFDLKDHKPDTENNISSPERGESDINDESFQLSSPEDVKEDKDKDELPDSKEEPEIVGLDEFESFQENTSKSTQPALNHQFLSVESNGGRLVELSDDTENLSTKLAMNESKHDTKKSPKDSDISSSKVNFDNLLNL